MKEAFNPTEYEPQIQKMWEEKQILKKIKENSKDKKKFNFLQGPPYTSGRLHLGQAWNHALKDAALRTKRMQGFNVWDRGGYDMHGLPTENNILKKLNLKLITEIENYGAEKFSEECYNFCTEMMQKMNVDLKRLGASLDFDNSYQPITADYIEGVWALVKEADRKGRLYQGKKTMGWCVPFATALSKHEMEYKEITHESVFVKFKIDGTQNEYFLIWTTTPWTLPLNLAIMAGPEIEYVKMKVEDEYWIMAKDLMGVFMGNKVDKEYSVVETVTGDKLEGKKYIHPFKDIMPAMQDIKEEKLHTVLLSSEYVDTSAGTGLVHCAPGCGPEDYEVGVKNGLPPFNEVNENGIFSENSGDFKGQEASLYNEFFIQKLKDYNMLIAQSPISHEYPHCERSKTPIVFRATEQWFFKVEDLKEKMLAENQHIAWVPQKAKNAFDGWLKNLRDNSITKQRFWGTPAPIWINEEDPSDYIVIGSIKELKELAKNDVPENLHKPFIDSVLLEKNGKTYKRIPDVLDVWIDAGTASWNCLDYMNNPKQFEEWFPADFICEGKDQIRGWFNLLMVASMLMFDKPAFKNVHLHGFISGIDGEKMSKSLGNIISPYEIVDKYGADTLRLYMTKVRAGEDVNFSWDEVKQSYRNLSMLYNVVNYFLDTVQTSGVQTVHEVTDMDAEEKYILSRLHQTIGQVTDLQNNFQMNAAPAVFEQFLFDVSRSYIQFVRDKLNQEVVAATLYQCITGLLKIAHPTVPFVTEYLYQKIKAVIDSPDYQEESIQMCAWPSCDTAMIDETLHEDFKVANNIIQSILAAREKAKLGVRWPIAQAIICSQSEKTKHAIDTMASLIMSQTNCKEVVYQKEFEKVQYALKPNYKRLGQDFGVDTGDVAAALQKLDTKTVQEVAATVLANKTYELMVKDVPKDITKDHVNFDQIVDEGYAYAESSAGFAYIATQQTEELELEGYARELMRRIQSLRKDAGFEKTDEAKLQVTLSPKLQKAFEAHKQAIVEKCGVKEVVETTCADAQQADGKVKEETFTLSIVKA